MNNTPNSNRINIALYGKTNVGKSSLLNSFLGSEVAVVSKVKGTTTDPVLKAMELIPVGPVLFIDTGGIDDESVLGKIRVDKTFEILKRTDIALYIISCDDIDLEYYEKMKIEFKKFNIPNIIVFNKIDVLSDSKLKELKSKFKNGVFVSAEQKVGLEALNEILIEKIEKTQQDAPLVSDLLNYNSKVILVVPIDSEAPKGRLILPQVQCIRECLDNGIKCYVVRDTELESALKDIKDIDLVITDSQAFKKVNKLIPNHIKLTSFSMLFARQKGDLKEFIKGVKAIEGLREDSKILICESCSHNVSHEDIGRVKIPNMINKKLGFKVTYDYKIGYDFTENIEEYDLIIHCGACMINRKTVLNRVKECKEKNVPITNYGIVIAYLSGILERASCIFDENK